MLQLVRLAWPVILSYLALMTMALVDVLYVGRVSAVAVGTVGVGSSVFSWFMVFGIGLLTGLDPLVSQAFGAGDRESCHRSFLQALFVAIALSAPLTAILCFGASGLHLLGVQPEIAAQARDFIRVLAFSLPAVYLFTAARQYLQGMSVVKVALVVMVLANGVNALIGWVLVFGKFGFPALGAQGTAWATTVARWFMAAAIFGYAWWWDRGRDRWFSKIPFRVEKERIRRLLKLGLPAALQLLLEVGVFALATVLAGGLKPRELAAHQIVLQIASLTFMVPLGMGAASGVLVGQAVGAGDRVAARRWGWRGFWFATIFMSCSATVFLLLPGQLIGLFTQEPEVVAAARGILLVAGLFQLSDGIQGVLTGALRGLGETRSSAIANLVGHWAIGLPVGTWLCFSRGWGLRGLWVGLSLGLTAVALALALRWNAASRVVTRPTPVEEPKLA
jgi:MATE family multidrug resistance protein